jgi:hypothetical protein
MPWEDYGIKSSSQNVPKMVTEILKERNNMTQFKVGEEVVLVSGSSEYPARVLGILQTSGTLVVAYRSKVDNKEEYSITIAANATPSSSFYLKKKPETMYMNIYSNGNRGEWNSLENAIKNGEVFIRDMERYFPESKAILLGRLSGERIVQGRKTTYSNVKFVPA